MSITSRLIIFLYLFGTIRPSIENDSLHNIAKRFVLFPRYSVVQITGGVSAPAILPKRSINLTLGFQMNHDLPWNFTNFLPLYGRENQENFDFDRTTMYEYLVNIGNALGLNGEDCLLRAICEVSEVPLHVEDDNDDDKEGVDLLEKILHFLLTPSNDFGQHGSYVNTSLEHKALVAEQLGESHGNCYKIFKCPISLLDFLTNKYY